MKRLSLKKPVMIAGLVLTIMLLTMVSLTVRGAHAAPGPVAGKITPRQALDVALAQAKKSSSCFSSSNVKPSTCKVTILPNGTVSFGIVGKNLFDSDTYNIYTDTLDNKCGAQGTTVPTSGTSYVPNLGTVYLSVIAGAPYSTTGATCTKGKVIILMQDITTYPYKTYVISPSLS